MKNRYEKVINTYIKTKLKYNTHTANVKIAQNDNLTSGNIKTPARDDKLTSKTDI